MTDSTYTVPDGPKMLRETLCAVQAAFRGRTDLRTEHLDRLDRLIAECDRKRPLGPDGVHGDLHTPECGCDDAPTRRAVPWPQAGARAITRTTMTCGHRGLTTEFAVCVEGGLQRCEVCGTDRTVVASAELDG